MAQPEGRPTVFTKEVLQKLEEAFALGCTDGEACYYADIAKSSLYNYQVSHPEFLERKDALKERPILMARQELIKGIKGNPELALKYLERKLKKEFALRTELTGENGQALTINVLDGINLSRPLPAYAASTGSTSRPDTLQDTGMAQTGTEDNDSTD